jgi:hypothetical protein
MEFCKIGPNASNPSFVKLPLKSISPDWSVPIRGQSYDFRIYNYNAGIAVEKRFFKVCRGKIIFILKMLNDICCAVNFYNAGILS